MKCPVDFSRVATPETPEELLKLQKDCIAMVRWWVWRARSKFGLYLPEPEVRFDLMGTTAGTANAGLNLIRFSPVLLRENVRDFLVNTTGHEVGHLVARNRHKGELIEPHGTEWRNVMWGLGLRADVCHAYDTDNVPSMRGRKRIVPQSPMMRNKDGTVTRFKRGVKVTEL